MQHPPLLQRKLALSGIVQCLHFFGQYGLIEHPEFFRINIFAKRKCGNYWFLEHQHGFPRVVFSEIRRDWQAVTMYSLEMAKGRRGRHRFASLQCRPSPYPLPCHKQHDVSRKCSKALENKDWEDATCSVCMEYPHNAVLLLCSSYDKGCRPYMCGTSYRYSNCLDQYKNAYTKVTFPHLLDDKVTELACPLCRGQVKGWTVVEPARVFLNAKKRNCMQDGCTFIGMYKEIRKHVKAEHPTAHPRQVDPAVEQKWRRFERERERDDVISTIRSSMPGARVFGDYVIEGNHSSDEEGEDGRNDEVGFDSNFVNVFFLLHAFEQAGNGELSRRLRRGSPETNHIHFSDHDDDSADDNDEDDSDDGGDISMVCYRAPAGRGRRGNGGGPR